MALPPMTLQELNATLRLTGSLKALEVAAAFPNHDGSFEVAYRRENPTFPGEPWVVHHVVPRQGAARGLYDLTREEAVEAAGERVVK